MAKMTHFMEGAGNTEICLRRNELLEQASCQVLTDLNIFAMVPPLSQANLDSPDIFVIATRVL